MKKLIALAALALAALPFTASPAEAAGDPTVDYILELAPGENPEVHADWLLGQLGVSATERDERVVYTYTTAINGVWLRLTASEADEAGQIQRSGIVNGRQAFDVSAPEDPYGPVDGLSAGTTQIIPPGYLRVDAQPDPGDAYSNVDIAILDTGVDSFHDDLNVVGGFDCTFEGLTGHRPADSWMLDEHGHGTHVFGIAAAKDNDRFTLGFAAGARGHSVPVLGPDGSGSMASVLCGLDWVAQSAAVIEVANLSLGGGNQPSVEGSWDSLHNGMANLVDLGVIVVVAAGNDGEEALTKSPANYPELVTVTAMADFDGEPGGLGVAPIPARDDWMAFFSNNTTGELADFIAPGVFYPSTYPSNEIAWLSGTSMASPVVAGVIAAHMAECNVTGQQALEEVREYSAGAAWTLNSGWEGDRDLDKEPLVRFGAPCEGES